VFLRKDDAVSRNVLLIEDNFPTAARVEQALRGSNDGSFVVERMRTCSAARARLGMDRDCAIAAVVTNLFLPDSQGLETIARIFEVSPRIPILVLTNPDNEEIARQAIQNGAQDYVLQHRLDSYSLPRMLENMLYRTAHSTAILAKNERTRIALKSIDDAVYDQLCRTPHRPKIVFPRRSPPLAGSNSH
jgi:DNA-binding NarL/FixJ family response regulator